MRSCLLAISLVLTIGLTLGPVHAAHHEGGPPVLQVFAVEADAKDRPAVLDRLKQLQAILKQEGLPALRVWAATYSGDSTGTLFVTIEQTNHPAFGANTVKTMQSDAIQKWLTDINNSGLAEVVSQSLLVDMTP